MRAVLSALTIMLVLPCTELAPQVLHPSGTRLGISQATVRRGQLVRLIAPAYGMHGQLARFLRVHQDTLTMRTDSVLKLPLATVAKLEVIRGRNNLPVYLGMVSGAFVGAVVGVKVAKAADQSHPPRAWLRPDLRDPEVAAVVGVLLGGFVGGLVGKVFRGDRWEEVPLDRLRVSFAQHRDGFAFGMRVAF